MCDTLYVLVQVAVMSELESLCVQHIRTHSGLTEFEDINDDGNVTLVNLSHNQIQVTLL